MKTWATGLEGKVSLPNRIRKIRVIQLTTWKKITKYKAQERQIKVEMEREKPTTSTMKDQFQTFALLDTNAS